MAHKTMSRLTVRERSDWEARQIRLHQSFGITRSDYIDLCTQQNTLHRWSEDECNGTIGREDPVDTKHDGFPYRREQHRNGLVIRRPIVDKELIAKHKIQRIVDKYPGIGWYHQSDPRGCQVYIYRSADLPEGADISCCYNSIGHPCYFA